MELHWSTNVPGSTTELQPSPPSLDILRESATAPELRYQNHAPDAGLLTSSTPPAVTNAVTLLLNLM